ncbi:MULTISPECIES: RHS repeat domain-containing protein [unclassified Agrococcus]|uniref:RHS repeat domain-containing protein n=1 Tax=unclassified Agrococcus TaxID=2615065 RepID=UPI00360806FA
MRVGSRLVTSEGAAGEHTYAYDAGGNILRMTGPLGETIQSFNAANQRTTSSGTVDASYEYDAAGQRIAETTPDGTTTTGYTALGQVARIATPDRSADYGYDGLGRALTVTDASGAGQQTTTQAWDGLDVIGQSNDEHGTTAVVRDRVGQLVLEAGDDDDARWALLDRLGSVVGQVGGGRIEQLASYSDFGEQAFGTTGWDSETGFGGEQVNPELGVTNYYARTYDPSTGTWLSQDSWRGLLAQPQTLARYAFVENNPTTFLDDSGFCSYKGRESGCRSTIGGKTPKPSPGGSRGTGSLGASIGAGQPIGSISRPSPRGVPAAAAGMAASAPAPAAASASFIPMRHDRPSAATAPCLGLLPFSIIPGLSVLPFLACGAASANSRVDYTYSWDLGAADGMSPEDAMAIFQQRPDEIFPFLIDGCTTLTTGSTCDLHAFELRGSPDWASFVAGLVPNGHGTVSVTSTPNSVLFEVQSDGYFEQAGSTIEFTVIERDGHLHLVQTGHGVPDSLLTEIANDNYAPWPTWWLQRMRFRDVLDEYRP